MEKIASFTIDHDRLEKGMYLSRTDFGDIYTYDIRMKIPNQGDYLTSAQAHSFEHLFATYARNSSFKDSVLYVGPMGCLTGFYLITKALPHTGAIQLVQESFNFIADFNGEIPGATKAECGNYALQDLEGAKKLAVEMTDILCNWNETDINYKFYL